MFTIDVTTKPCKRVLTFDFITQQRKFYLSLPSMFFRLIHFKDRTNRKYDFHCQCYMIDKNNKYRNCLLPNVLSGHILCTTNVSENLRTNPAILSYFSGSEDPFDQNQLVEIFLSDFWNSAFDPKVRPDIILKSFNISSLDIQKKFVEIKEMRYHIPEFQLYQLASLSLIADLYQNWEDQTKLNPEYDIFSKHSVPEVLILPPHPWGNHPTLNNG